MKPNATRSGTKRSADGTTPIPTARMAGARVLVDVEVPQEDQGQVGDDEGPQLVDERPHDEEAHGAREAPDDPERVLEHGANGPLYNGPPHRRERRCTRWSCCGTERAPGTSRTASRGGRTWTSRRRAWRRRSPGRSSSRRGATSSTWPTR